MSLRVVLGWALGILGVLIILDIFGAGFGIHAPFPILANIIVGIILIYAGVSLASGRAIFTS